MKFLQGNFDSAITDFDEAIKLKLEPGLANAYLMRGLVKAALGQHKLAITDYDTAIRLDPNLAETYSSRAYAKIKLGDFTSAIADYDAAIRLQSNSVEPFVYDTAVKAYLYRGMAKAMQNHMEEAKSDFYSALKLAEQAIDQNLKDTVELILEINDNGNLKVFIEECFQNLE